MCSLNKYKLCLPLHLLQCNNLHEGSEPDTSSTKAFFKTPVFKRASPPPLRTTAPAVLLNINFTIHIIHATLICRYVCICFLNPTELEKSLRAETLHGNFACHRGLHFYKLLYKNKNPTHKIMVNKHLLNECIPALTRFHSLHFSLILMRQFIYWNQFSHRNIKLLKHT